MADELGRVLRELRELRQSAEEADWSVPPEPEWLDPFRQYRMEWARPELQLRGDVTDLGEIRVAIPMRVGEHEEGDGTTILLIRVPAGGGKTHGAVHAAQRAAASGRRVLYCAGRHAFYSDVQAIPDFTPDQWYHWLPIHENTGEHDPIPTTCRYAKAMHTWLVKGYGAFDLCQQLCLFDGWVKECPYRKQQTRQEPIVFAMHQNLVKGLAISDFDLAIVDELPLQAFVEKRLVPKSGLDVGATGPLGELATELGTVAESANARIAGRALFDRIGPILRDVYAQVEVLPDMLPVVPRVYSPQMVRDVPYWYVFDLLRLASPEYDAWRSGWPRWAERVWLDNRGLRLLDRALPWKDLPARVVALDATGRPGIYRTLFGREVEEYAPQVKRPGRIYQVTHRLNGINALLDAEANPSDRAHELVWIAGEIARHYTGRVAAVTHKRLAPLFEERFGEGNVLHFHALRGTNQLQDVEALIVAGSPSPNTNDVIDLATALNPTRIQSFVALDPEGRKRPLWGTARREYLVTDQVRAEHDGLVPFRGVSGFWSVPELQEVYDQLREQELVQAIHRARPNVRACEVWVLTSVPTGEPMDGVWDGPPVAPPGIHWPTWRQLQVWLRSRLGSGLPITNADLAQATGRGEGWVRERKMLAGIIATFPNDWELGRLDPRGRGRPVRAAIPRISGNYAGSGY